MKKTIGIIGAGNIGKAAAAHFVKAGYTVLLSNNSDADTLKEIVSGLGDNAVASTVKDAAEAEIVFLALPWSEVPTLSAITNWQDRIVIDATNHFISYSPDFKVADTGGKPSSEITAGHLIGSKIVKAFNTLPFKVLAADPVEPNGRRVMFLSGNHPEANKVVAEAIDSIGFASVDLGDLSFGKFQEPKNIFAAVSFIKQ